MIQFRCWYCWKNYTVKESRIGEQITCSCKNILRVPNQSGGNCRVRTLVDWIVEFVVCGLGCALLGLGLAILIIWQLRWFVGLTESWILIAVFTGGGFFAGLFGGMRAIDWIGNMIRDHENR